MLIFDDFATLRESNGIEYKSARGGFPNSFWETYSAFANTDGGIIVLGAKEGSDGLPVPSGLDDPHKLVKALWDGLNNRKKTSANILVDANVSIENVSGMSVVVVKVPRASREARPVFINGDMFEGSYRRNGEGDYHCSRFEVTSMVRDSFPGEVDRRTLDAFAMDALSQETLRSYRQIFDDLRPRHPWMELADEEFLMRIGAAARSDTDGRVHPTHAGLLMFGEAWRIVEEYPDFYLDCRQVTEGRRWDNRIVSSSGDWSGNVFDFYGRAYRMLVEGLPVPFRLDANMRRVDDTPQHKAVREALANALIHADYYGRAGIVAIRYADRIEIANPGLLRTPVDVIRGGGISDPRNATLMTMFNLLSIGEKAGSGYDVMRQSTESVGKSLPEYRELYDPERVFLTLQLEVGGLGYGARGDGSVKGENTVLDTLDGDSSKTVGNDPNVDPNDPNVDPNDPNIDPNDPNIDPNDPNASLTRRQRLILQLLSSDGSLTYDGLAARLSVSNATVKREITQLKLLGLVARSGRTRGTWEVL